LNNATTTSDTSAVFTEVTPGTFQQFVALLVERLAASELPEMAGMLHLRGRWMDPGKPNGKLFFNAKVGDDGGAQVKVEIPASLVASRGVASGQDVILTGRLIVRSSHYGVEVKLSATDIQLGERERPLQTAMSQPGRMTLERLRLLSFWRVPFPDHDKVSITLIQPASAVAQVADDCIAELTKLKNIVSVSPVRVNMLDPIAITAAIKDATAVDIVMIIRGGGDAADFEVFDDPRVLTALAEQKAHRVLGLGHTGNVTLLDLIADYSANTPAQAGAYIRERIQQRQRMLAETGRELRLIKERMQTLEKERNTIQSQLATTKELLATKTRGMPSWAVAVAFIAGAILIWLIR
jgi:exodeoxyribonuclease VII large subunit